MNTPDENWSGDGESDPSNYFDEPDLSDDGEDE